MKLMDRFKILQNQKQITQQVTYLEEEGKTVIILAIDKTPSLIITLEEAHLSEVESKYVIQYL